MTTLAESKKGLKHQLATIATKHIGTSIIGLVIGSAGGSVMAGLAFVLAGGGHGTYLPGMLFFPYTMLTSLSGEGISEAGISFALVQFPLYGLIMGMAWPLNGARRITRFAVIAIHIVAVICAFMFVEGY